MNLLIRDVIRMSSLVCIYCLFTRKTGIINGGIPQETIPITAESEDKPGYITSIFPNPANEVLTINYLIKVPGKVSFTISSVTGQESYTHQKANNSAGEYTVSLDISDLPEGIYFIAF